MNKWQVMGNTFENIGVLLQVECENMATSCSFDPGFEQMYEHYEIMLRTLTTQHKLIQDAFGMLDARFSADAESGNEAERAAQLEEDLEDHQTERIKGLWQ